MTARIVADSISITGDRVTTFEVRFHRFVLAEFNTHRVFSRNSASSRAIPVAKQLDRVLNDPADPVEWPSEQKGMQGGGDLHPESLIECRMAWDEARANAIGTAQTLTDEGLHKSLANRILEPFMWHTVVVTATAWDNFFDQRLSPLAQPEIRIAAEAMHDAYFHSTPQYQARGEWHLPYVIDEEIDHDQMSGGNIDWRQISAARCARVSYLTQDGVRDLDADQELYKRLTTAKPAHWSPLEHVATPWEDNRQTEDLFFVDRGEDGEFGVLTDHLPRVGNLLGWRSLRTTVEAQQGQVTYR